MNRKNKKDNKQTAKELKDTQFRIETRGTSGIEIHLQDGYCQHALAYKIYKILLQFVKHEALDIEDIIVIMKQVIKESNTDTKVEIFDIR
jgi:hypothetical protein